MHRSHKTISSNKFSVVFEKVVVSLDNFVSNMLALKHFNLRANNPVFKLLLPKICITVIYKVETKIFFTFPVTPELVG